MPVPAMQTAWAKYGNEWKEKFKICEATNPGWITLSCAVPVKDLFAAMGEMLRFNFSPFESPDTASEFNPLAPTPEELKDSDYYSDLRA